jgi:hypothetical protein
VNAGACRRGGREGLCDGRRAAAAAAGEELGSQAAAAEVTAPLAARDTAANERRRKRSTSAVLRQAGSNMGVGRYQRHVRANFRRDHPVSDLHGSCALHSWFLPAKVRCRRGSTSCASARRSAGSSGCCSCCSGTAAVPTVPLII